jgi:hypothetical protein
MDELGMVCWDENHRNGQEDQVPLLILRDRNHPSVVIWSICQFRRPPRAPKNHDPPKQTLTQTLPPFTP